eukprot:TRINITY_DN80528_c0_g1_i1.p1 TRINITY_DN80528_c0_g1~~TRINITY_DN80528_c0_g1_i1.p1  ORF type:complete len:188 (-),score=55.94 TRINITY_DN80528_c0_g1_i1:102-665(-)
MDLSLGITKKALLKFLSNLSKSLFFPDEGISESTLHASLAHSASVSIEDAQKKCSAWAEVLREASQRGWESVEMEKKLSETGELSEEVRDAVVSFWAKEAPRIRSRFRENAMYNPTLKDVQWRVDLIASSKDHEGDSYNASVDGMIQIEGADGRKCVIRVDADHLDDMITNLESLQTKLESFAKESK